MFNYQGTFDGDSFSSLKRRIDNNYHSFIFIRTENNMRFGFYIEDIISFDKKNRYINKENNCFIMSFQKEGIFNCIGKKNKLEMKNDNEGMIVIGDGDIIIKKNYYSNEESGVINYPFKSFDISTINNNIFTDKNGAFPVRGVEVFSFEFNWMDL